MPTPRKRAEHVADETPEMNNVDEALVTSAPDDWEFETVQEESATGVIFTDIGETFVGEYRGPDHIEPDGACEPDCKLPHNKHIEAFDRYTFRARDGKLYALNQSYGLIEGMKKVETGQWVRITYMADIATSRGLNSMKDFKIEVRKNA